MSQPDWIWLCGPEGLLQWENSHGRLVWLAVSSRGWPPCVWPYVPALVRPPGGNVRDGTREGGRDGVAAVQGPRGRIGNADGRFMQSIMELGLPVEGVNRKVELNVRGRLKKNTNAHTHTHTPNTANQPASMVQHDGNLSNFMILALIVNMNAFARQHSNTSRRAFLSP